MRAEPLIAALARRGGLPVLRSARGTGRRLLVAGLLLVLSLGAAWQTHRVVQSHQQSRFDNEVRRIESAMQQRMTAYVQVLRGGLGLFEVATPVSFDDWLNYVAALQLPERYPGFKSLSFAAAVRPEDLDAFVSSVRGSPIPAALQNVALISAYTLRSPVSASSTPPIHSPIVYVAPLIPENERVLGVDMMQEPLRRAVMEQAAETGAAVLSPRIQLAGQGDRKAGFIAYLAVRREGRLQGWLTAAFRADDFMRGLQAVGTPVLDFEVYDGAAPQADSLLYSTAGIEADGRPRLLPARAGTPLTQWLTLQLPGRVWTLRYVAARGFEPLTDRLTPWLVLLGGVLATALFYAVASASARLRVALDQLADQNRQLQGEIRIREEAESRVRHQATHDLLTGLANRHLFIDRLSTALERARRRGQSFSLAYIDIDGFKAVNDNHGHQAGDELLRLIAARLQNTLRREDTLARLGGDEFAVLFEQAHEPPAAARQACVVIVECLREAFTLTTSSGPVTAQIGASVGVALYPQHGRDADALIAAADAAMYRAKRSGKNRCELADESPSPAGCDSGRTDESR